MLSPGEARVERARAVAAGRAKRLHPLARDPLDAGTGLHDGGARARLVDDLRSTSTGRFGGVRVRREEVYGRRAHRRAPRAPRVGAQDGAVRQEVGGHPAGDGRVDAEPTPAPGHTEGADHDEHAPLVGRGVAPTRAADEHAQPGSCRRA